MPCEVVKIPVRLCVMMSRMGERLQRQKFKQPNAERRTPNAPFKLPQNHITRAADPGLA